MSLEKITWAAVSGAIFTVFWPWLLAEPIVDYLDGHDHAENR